MKHLMKKLWMLSICLVLITVLASAAAAKPAATAEFYVKVCCDDGNVWEDCRIHWLGSKTLCSWPGEQMTREESGHWSASVPADARNLIFSCGSCYSPVLTMPEGENMVYIFKEDCWRTCDPADTDAAFYVVGNTPAFHTGWDELRDANRMHPSGDEWRITYEDVPAGYWEFAVTNGREYWGDEHEENKAWRFLAEGTGDMTITFYPEEGNVGFGYTYDPPLDIPVMTIYCRAPESWESCYAFWSGSANICTPEPGEAMEYVGDGLWQLKVYSDIREVSFSNGCGEGRSAQVPYSDRLLYDYSLGRWECPVKVGELSTLRVVGNADFMGSWDVAAENGRMTRLEENRYEACFEDVPPGHYEFRVAADANWNRYWPENDRNYTVDVEETCDLTITFELEGWSAGEVTIRRDGEEATESWTSQYRVVGNAPFMGHWDPAYVGGVMTENEEGLYEKRFYSVDPGDYEFKITYGGTWDYSWGDEDGNNYVMDVQTVSDVTVTFDPTDEVIHVTVEPLAPDQQEFRVVGNAAFMANWNPNSNAGLMEMYDDGLYEKWFYNVAPGDYEFRIVRGTTWDHQWSDDGINYVQKITSFSNFYISFDLLTGTVSTKVEPVANGSVWRVVGNSEFFGDWDPAFEGGRMTEAAPGVYQKTFYHVAPGEYEITVTADGCWPGTNIETYAFQLVMQADIIVTFDSNSNTISVKGIGPAYCGEGGPDEPPCNLAEVAMIYTMVRCGKALKSYLAPYLDFNGDGNVNILDVAELYRSVKTAAIKE